MGTGELKKTAAIDHSAKNSENRSESREEGELSCYEDDDIADGFASPLNKFNGSQEKSIQAEKVIAASEGTVVPSSKSGDLVDLPTSFTLHSSHQKNHEKNRGSFVPFVISFSDEDSGSDCEERKQQNAIGAKGKSLLLESSRRPPVSSLPKQTTRAKYPVTNRKASLSRTFVSSRNKIDGTTSGNRSSPALDHLPKKNVHLNTTKLQDLRQMIAIREKELKLKSSQKNKFSGLDAQGTSDTINFRNGKGRQATLAEPKKPEKKRLKITEPHPNRMDISGQQVEPPGESMLASKDSLLENNSQQILENSSHHTGKYRQGTSRLIHAQEQKQNENLVPVSGNLLIAAKKGSGTTSRQIETKSKLAYSSISSEKSMQVANKDPETTVKKLPPAELDSQFTAISTQIIPDNEVSDTSDQVPCNDKVPEPILNEKYQASLGYQSFWKNLGELTVQGNSNVDAKSLLDFEDAQDKELEEAQEHRHQCEIEERIALKAYRKAQKALIEATARCNYLYGQRELYSAHLRNLMTNNPNMFWSLRTDDMNGAALQVSNNLPMDATPEVNQVCIANDAPNNGGSDLNVHPGNDATQLSDLNAAREKFPSEPCSEPDGSTSPAHNEAGMASGAGFLSDNSSLETRIKDYEGNGVYFASRDSSMSFDEDEHQFDGKSTKENLEVGKEMSDGQGTQLLLDSSHDSLLLEVSLRSQLFERFRKRSLSKNGESSQSMVPVDKGRLENDDAGMNWKTSARKKSEITLGTEPMSDANKDGNSELQGQNSTMHHAFCAVAKSVIGHLKVSEPKSSPFLIRSADVASPHVNRGNDGIPVLDKSEPSMLCQDPAGVVPTAGTCCGQMGSYSCNHAINPFRPLCIYELRGKCNDDECSWQHLRDFTAINMKHDAPNKPDPQAGSPSWRGPWLADSLLNNLVLAPTYLVGLDVLKADMWCNSILSGDNGQCWRKCFSASMVLSSLLPTDSPLNEPFLHGTEAHIEVHGAWNRQSFYFHCKNGTKSKDGHFADNDQSLEMAFLNLNQEADKRKGRIEALKVIARALESNPTSTVLWIIYLQIYYCNQESIGKDDLFRYAVKLSKGSYELWLMYINSREQLVDRLAAYDVALSALCCHASNSDGDFGRASQCILDIFIQMMNFLCMSGNAEQAVQKICELFPAAMKSDNSRDFYFSDIITCFTISDACIFWICCVYLVIYRKLPDSVALRIEGRKEISAIEWPSIDLSLDEKVLATSLMELAVDSLAQYMDGKSLKSEATLWAAHLFAINHIKCVQVLEGFECSRTLLKNYVKLYPSCLELVLILARVEYDAHNSSFVGFEEALSNWEDEVPGIQCIWYQYAECALQNGKLTLVKELMERWFDSVLKMGFSENRNLNRDPHDGDSQNVCQPVSVADLCRRFSCHAQIDVLFALLNFSLYKILQNDEVEALLALERALKTATTAEYYSYCVGEHIQLLLTNKTLRDRNGHNGDLLKILNYYLDDAPVSTEPSLSRDFIQKVEKPGLRQLVSKLLTPVSSDTSLLNLVLEVLYGPSLLPQISDKLKDLVDFVEGLMEIRPSNYRLAISVCKLLHKSSDNVVNAAVSFWASSLVVNSLFHAVPVAPESVWVEAANIFQNLVDSQTRESFLKRALSVYPFSIKLWRRYLNLARPGENANSVKEAAREKGIILE